MASIEQLQAEINDANTAITELKQATSAEKQEIADKIQALDAKVTEQTGLIEQLKQEVAGNVPDSLLSELADVTTSIRSTTNEIKSLVEPSAS
ncbi:hypothetical protein G7B40_040145 [Aetokthonos hydrillicola Thurmond2011]|uniref:Uncharacterized protein n=1 Tax=Aetokthonos hydrillicola Thurmond2011 TaxID=2712845 RepID=A0AAP5IFD0_9CYAN|nr:hypothetical protein [Aetokthonos hydrillicola]MBO3459940.1 hypothetical protein [Aetokthonos hydrillicola CCALA 1050]MBW4584059.1 hypothetical protein [Aetokthonos hydrillicola CCALA 1050]MDR9900701.1 hypothetical protein [Aetokthonos hydrillicola Thurmond2011]